MSDLQGGEPGSKVMSRDAVECIRNAARDMTKDHLVDVVKRIAMSHERLRMEMNGAIVVLDELHEYKAEIGVTVNGMEQALSEIATGRNDFSGPSLDYMQGYRDGQEYQARIAHKALGHGEVVR